MGFETTTETKPSNVRGRAAAKWYRERGLQPPSKTDKAPRRTTRARKPTRTNVAAKVLGGISIAQGIALMMLPEKYADDQLTMPEILALADAVTDEVMTSDYLLRMFGMLDKGGPHTKLAMVVGMIALPRLAKYGVLPSELEPAIRQLAASTFSMVAGSTHDPDRGHGQREVDTSVDSPTVANLYDNLPVEGGFGQVRNGYHGEDSGPNEESEVPPNRVEAES